jgi:hypothetical protein
MGIVTNDVKVGAGNLPKSFSPGNHTAKINSISLRWPEYLKKKGEKAYEVVLDLETRPIGDSFEGWLVDKEQKDGPRVLGQTARVKTRKWPYKDGSWTGNGKTIKFDMVLDILKVIQLLEEEAGSTFLKDTSDKFDTIEEIVEAFNKAQPFKDIYFKWCVGGEEEVSEEGFSKYYMFLPKFEKGYKLFANENNAQHILPYDKALHVESKGGAKPATPVNSFPAGAGAGGAGALWDAAGKDEDIFTIGDDGEDDVF